MIKGFSIKTILNCKTPKCCTAWTGDNKFASQLAQHAYMQQADMHAFHSFIHAFIHSSIHSSLHSFITLLIHPSTDALD